MTICWPKTLSVGREVLFEQRITPRRYVCVLRVYIYIIESN